VGAGRRPSRFSLGAHMEPIDLLDRQYERLRTRDGVAFMRELPRFYETITAGPTAVVAAMRTLRKEAEACEREFQDADLSLIPELVQLRSELVALAPECDDSGDLRPPNPTMSWTYGLANFDQLASHGPDRLVERGDDDPSRSGMMLRILQSKLNELRHPVPTPGILAPDGAAPQEPQTGVDDFGRRLGNAADLHRHHVRTYQQACNSRGGFQFQVLDLAIEQLNPAPRNIQTDEDRHHWIRGVFMRSMSGWAAVEAAVAGHPHDGDISRHMVESLTEKTKAASDVVYEDLRLKLISTPSTYSQRLTGWLSSPSFGIFETPCAAGAVTGITQANVTGVVVFVALAAVFAILPPALRNLPDIKLNAVSLVCTAVAAAVIAVVFVTTGFAAALLAGLLLGGAFMLGKRSRP
jgi:hypothetical protein